MTHCWQLLPQWTQDAETALAGVLPGCKNEIIQDIHATPARAQLWKISGPGYAGFLVTRIELLNTGEKELVLVAARGHGYGAAIEHIKQIARANGIKTIRAHSYRKGYVRYVKRFGMVLIEHRADGEQVVRGQSGVTQ